MTELKQLPVLIAHYESHHTKPVGMGILKICMVAGERTVFIGTK
jgi:hypothetical protein